jgi:hypothetical protein
VLRLDDHLFDRRRLQHRDVPRGQAAAVRRDFFDVENFPGRRAIQDRPGANLEWALYADGVAIEDIYDVLETQRASIAPSPSSTPSRTI